MREMPRRTMPMAMQPFTGVTRTLVIANVAVFFVLALLGAFARESEVMLERFTVLQPAAVASAQIWRLVTYSFVHTGILEILFAMFTLWICGGMLESAYGGRWLRDLYFTSAIGAAVLASVLSYVHVLYLSPLDVARGSWAAIFGVLIAIAMRMGDMEFLFFFVIPVRARFMVGIYILIAVAMLLKDRDTFGALVQLSGALAGYLYVRYAPRRGLALGLSESAFELRNAYYRARRRRAAKKFEVYMGKQGRQVRFDEEGRYIDPDDPNRRDPNRRDPNDKRWMN
jgi:membrane associated rhomboid family serine protease